MISEAIRRIFNYSKTFDHRLGNELTKKPGLIALSADVFGQSGQSFDTGIPIPRNALIKEIGFCYEGDIFGVANQGPVVALKSGNGTTILSHDYATDSWGPRFRPDLTTDYMRTDDDPVLNALTGNFHIAVSGPDFDLGTIGKARFFIEFYYNQDTH